MRTKLLMSFRILGLKFKTLHCDNNLAVSQSRYFDLFTDFAKVLIRLKVRTQVVPQKGIELRPRAPLILNHITYPIVCKRLMCLQVVSDVQSDVQI